MGFENITPQEHIKLVSELIRIKICNSDENMLELGLVRNIDHKQSTITYIIVNKHKWFLAKIKYGI